MFLLEATKNMKKDIELEKFKRDLAEFVQNLNKPEPKITTDLVTSQDKLSLTMDEAAQSTGMAEHHVPGFEPRFVPKPAMASSVLMLGTDLAPILSDNSNIHRPEFNLLANEAFTLDAAVTQVSRVCQAGAKLIIADEQFIPNTTGMLAYQSNAAILRVIEAADLATVNEGNPITSSALPFTDAAVNWRNENSHLACRFTVSRKQRKQAGFEGVAYDLITAIVLGLAKTADKALLTAIQTLNPTAFSFGAAAARNVTYEELSGFIGTNGTGAQLSGNGKLYAGGLVQAELTPAINTTLIGAWNRVGVAVHPEVNIVVERLNAESDLNISVFCDIQAAIPSGSQTAFWSVA